MRSIYLTDRAPSRAIGCPIKRNTAPPIAMGTRWKVRSLQERDETAAALRAAEGKFNNGAWWWFLPVQCGHSRM